MDDTDQASLARELTRVVSGQHARVKALFTAVTTADPEERAASFADLARYLAIHEAAEQTALHAASVPSADTDLGTPAGGTGADATTEEVSARRLREEQMAGDTITTLESMDAVTGSFRIQVELLEEAVRQHAEAEETEELPRVLAERSPEELTQAATTMRRVDELYADGSSGAAVPAGRPFAEQLAAARRALATPDAPDAPDALDGPGEAGGPAAAGGSTAYQQASRRAPAGDDTSRPDPAQGPERDLPTFVELVKEERTCMFTSTKADGTIWSRPMAVQAVDDDGTVWFLTFADAEKVSQLAERPEVNLAFASASTWVSASGTGRLVDDLAKKKELWNPFAEAWFEREPEDPDVVLLRVDVTGGEYWDGPHGPARLFGMVKALVARERPDEGKNAKLDLA